jgi:threonine dehydrogenase-like Zn-dependent dehydrogenase
MWNRSRCPESQRKSGKEHSINLKKGRMLAMNYRGPQRVRIDQKPMPEILHPQDAIVRVTRACICGSDLHLYNGNVPDTRVGTTFGHEFVGVVEEIGSEVQKLKVGDNVLVPFNIACGQCAFCKQELFGNCHESNSQSTAVGGIFGYSHTAGGYDGGQAEYVRVPFADVGPMKVPEDMDDEDVIFLTDILPTGYQAAEMGGIRDGDTVVVFGCGPVGVFAQKAAWLMGAGRVIAVDHLDDRLAFCRHYNGVEAVNFRRVADVVGTLKELTGRGPDVCIDAVGLEADGDHLHDFLGRVVKLQAGAATAIEWCINTVRKGGTVVLVGVYGPPWNLVPMGTAMNKGLTMRMGQCNTRRYMPHLLEHIREGRIEPKRLITHRFPLSEVADAYRMFARKEDGCRKVVLKP